MSHQRLQGRNAHVLVCLVGAESVPEYMHAHPFADVCLTSLNSLWSPFAALLGGFPTKHLLLCVPAPCWRVKLRGEGAAKVGGISKRRTGRKAQVSEWGRRFSSLARSPNVAVAGSHPPAFSVGLLLVEVLMPLDRLDDAIPASHAVVLTS